jgi:hypothetical protein
VFPSLPGTVIEHRRERPENLAPSRWLAGKELRQIHIVPDGGNHQKCCQTAIVGPAARARRGLLFQNGRLVLVNETLTAERAVMSATGVMPLSRFPAFSSAGAGKTR